MYIFEYSEINGILTVITECWKLPHGGNFRQSAMLSFGTCNGNRGGFTVCAVKNSLGILVCLVVVFIPNALDLNCRIYVVEATVENKCTVSVCVFKTTITQVMLSVLSLFILFPVVFHVALVYDYFYL